MRIAFYAPLKPPDHAVPSGDRQIARLFVEALRQGGHQPFVASRLRSFDGAGDARHQARIGALGQRTAKRLVKRWRERPGTAPELWFTYHLYYKAPDWLGPAVSQALGIPYVIAEASYAQKRAHGPWAFGHEGSAAAIRNAALVLAPTRDDIPGLEQIIDPRRILHLPPFLDTAPYVAAVADRQLLRDELAEERELDAEVPWIAVV